MKPIPGTITDPAATQNLPPFRPPTQEPIAVEYRGVFRIIRPVEFKLGKFFQVNLLAEEIQRGEHVHPTPLLKTYVLADLLDSLSTAARAQIAALTGPYNT